MINRLTAMPRFLAPYTRLAFPGLAGTLALLLAVEWALPGPDTETAPHPALPKASALAVEGDASQWATTALARPLFSPDRRPGAAADMTGNGGLPRLSAIVMTDQGATAIFAPDGQKPQLITVGGDIGGYALQRIKPDSVQLMGPDGPVTLHPQFAPAAASPAAEASAPPPAQAAQTSHPPAQAQNAAPPAAAPPGQATQSGFHPQPRATPTSNPALYLEQNF